MTPRSFFTILIKILGLYLVFDFLVVISQALGSIFVSVDLGSRYSGSGDAWIQVGVILLSCALYIGILYLCVYKTGWIIDKLALDKHFEEEKLELNIHRSTILNIAVIVIGGLMFVDALPAFCKDVFSYIEQKEVSRGYENPTTYWMAYYFVKGLIGYLLVTSHTSIVNLVERQRKKGGASMPQREEQGTDAE